VCVVNSTCELLVASPKLDDSTFERTVVLLLERGPGGALGVVLNRPTGVAVDHILEPWRQPVLLAPPGVLFNGGPVARDAVIGLGRGAEGVESVGWRPLFEDVGTVDLSFSPDDLSVALRGVRLFSGYSGWSPGQLDDEIDEGAWFVVGGVGDDAFVTAPETHWHDVLRRQRGRLAMLATYPPSPLVN
jgi:putative transcriptional regulator